MFQAVPPQVAKPDAERAVKPLLCSLSRLVSQNSWFLTVANRNLDHKVLPLLSWLVLSLPHLNPCKHKTGGYEITHSKSSPLWSEFPSLGHPTSSVPEHVCFKTLLYVICAV